jgi:hypothetical protein
LNPSAQLECGKRASVDVYQRGLTMARWRELIDAAYAGTVEAPIVNLDDQRGSHFDAIFLGGGSAGRFGAAVAPPATSSSAGWKACTARVGWR